MTWRWATSYVIPSVRRRDVYVLFEQEFESGSVRVLGVYTSLLAAQKAGEEKYDVYRAEWEEQDSDTWVLWYVHGDVTLKIVRTKLYEYPYK